MNENTLLSVDSYIAELFGGEDESLAGARKSIPAAGMPEISVSVTQGQLLHLFAMLARSRRILEIGTLGGYSTICLARALPANGVLISLELEENHAEVARKNLRRAGLAERVEIRVGPALDSLPGLANPPVEPFDLVFIDADKEPYPEYLRWALKLTRPGSLIVADNVVRDGAILDSNNTSGGVEGVRKFNAALGREHANGRVTATILQTVGEKGHDGMALAVVKR